MSNLLLSLLVPSVTADKGEKSLPLGAANPLDPAQDLPISFKEVLAMMDRYGAEAKTVAQIKQELQALSMDARAIAHSKFLAELSDGDADANPFAGMAAMPGLIPQVAQPNYHAVAAVVDALPEVSGVPATSIPLQSMPLDAYASPEDQLAGAMQAPSSVPESADASEPLPQDISDIASPAMEENLSGGSATSSFDQPPLPQGNQSVAELAEVAEVVEPLPSVEDVTEISAGDVPSATDIASLEALSLGDASSDIIVTARALADISTNEVGLASATIAEEAAPVVSLNEPRESQKEIGPRASLGAAAEIEGNPSTTDEAVEQKGESSVKEHPTLSEKTAENAVEGKSSRATALPPGFEKVDPFAMAMDRAAPGVVLASSNGRPFDSNLADDSRMVQVQAEIRPGQPMGDQLRVHIRSSVAEGHDQIRIHLKPETLGSIDIAIDMNQDGSAQVRVIADRSETFDLLQRDARGLERALADAGIKADSGSLQFQLRGESQNQQANGQSGTGDGRGYGQRGDGQQQGNAQRGTAQEIVEIEDNGMYRLVATTGLNIRV